MSAYGSQTTVVFIKNAKVKIGGTDLAVAKNVNARWGNEIYEEEILGTDIPVTGTGRFSGTIEIEYLYCTDLNLATLVDPGADGQVPETTITEELKDTQEVAKTDTWTFKARLNRPEILGRVGGFVVARVTGVMTARPTRAQA